ARFLEAQNVIHLREVTVDHLETFKTAGLPKKMRATTKATTFAKIRCFLRAAFRRGWIKEALVDKVAAVKAVYDQKEPYTDKEITTILDQAFKMDGGTHGYAKRPKTFRLLLELMLATGLRVGDAVGFDPHVLCKGDSLWIYTYSPQKQKRAENPKLLEAYITDEMKKRIDECTWLSVARPFWYGLALIRRRLLKPCTSACRESAPAPESLTVVRIGSAILSLSEHCFAGCNWMTFRGFLGTPASR